MHHPSKSIPLHEKLTLFLGVSLQIFIIILLARLTIDVGTRMVYPFIPQLAAALGLSIIGFSWLLFVRSLAGLAGPVFGFLADRYGRRKLMATGLLCQSIGVIGLGLSSQWWAVIPMIFYGLALTAFIPAEQAYISELAPYEKRGRALGAIEFSWAAAGIIASPIVGWMIERFGWQSPFFVSGVVSFIGAVLVWRLLPAVEHHEYTQASSPKMWQVFSRANVLASMGVSMLVFVAVSCFSTVWSIWLNRDFGLGAVALGLIATIIGLAELSGSGLSSLFIDRIGKRRGSQTSLLLSAFFFLLLPLTQSSLALAVAGLGLIGVAVEFSVVALIPLYAEQAPEARATVFSLVGLGTAIGVSAGAPITATLWEQNGLGAVCAVAIVALLVATVLVTKFLHDR